MNTRISAAILAALAGTAALLLPGTGLAANVGTYSHCWNGSKTPAITAAGHTSVAVPALTSASLNGLAALIVESCTYNQRVTVLNSDVASAVSNGMLLIVNDWDPGVTATAASLPGAPAVTWTSSTSSNNDIVAGMPYISGIGGTLTNTSLDGGSSSSHGYTTTALPAGVSALLTTQDPSQTVAIRYSFGAGTVIYNAIPMDAYLPGGSNANRPNAAGLQTYLVNILSNPLVTTTCASEGYTGTQLEWCKNVCENGYSGAVLSNWIHRWINRYRTLPYCGASL